jgi:hypothetical protein
VDGGGGNDTINVQSTLPNVPVTINLGNGTDIVNISPSAKSLSTIRAPVTVNGGTGFDTLNVSDQNYTGPAQYTETATGITRNGSAGVSFNRIDRVVITCAGGGDAFNVLGGALAQVIVNGGAGANTMTVAALGASLTVIDSSLGSGTWTFPNHDQLSFNHFQILSDEGVLDAIQADAFLDHVYQDLLGRDITQDELAYWGGQMNSGVSPAGIATAVFQDPSFLAEYRQHLVTTWWLAYFGAPPTQADLNTWTGVLAGGATDEQVQAARLASVGFRGYGAPPDVFVADVYAALNLAPDANYQTYINALASGSMSHYDVAYAVLTGPTYRAALAESYFEHFLHRAGLSGEISTIVGQLSVLTDEAVIANWFVGSTEYFNRA